MTGTKEDGDSRSTIQIKVTDVNPGASYQGTVYTQSIWANLPNGESVRLDDSRNLVHCEDVDNELNARITGFSVEEIEENDENSMEVRAAEAGEVVISGCVTSVDLDHEHQLVIETNVGIFHLSVLKEVASSAANRDWITISGVALSIKDIER